jgi:hypothetical protein
LEGGEKLVACFTFTVEGKQRRESELLLLLLLGHPRGRCAVQFVPSNPKHPSSTSRL